MTAKEKKSREELTKLLMEEIRRHPECKHITGVAFTRPTYQNWQAAWSVSGPKIAPPRASEIARTFENQFDLVD